MPIKPSVLIFLNDWRVDPEGANCGGGEIATISLAESFAKLGFRTICCGNLTVPEGTYRQVEYWSFGETYNLSSLLPRIKQIGNFYCFAATLVHPFLLLKDLEACLCKVLINHSPGIVSSGLEPRTVSYLVDFHVLVSEAQKNLILMRGDVPDHNMHVIKNGYDPVQFAYAGPEQRDFKRLMFAGRLEAPKGIHLLLGAYLELVREFPDLKLDIFGSQNHWSDLDQELIKLQVQYTNLKYHGKVSRQRIAENMQKSGLLVFPSTSFETAGLVVLEAQGCGCPVVASNIGGIPEYVQKDCGMLLSKPETITLTQVVRSLLNNPTQLKQMSVACSKISKIQSWEQTALELLDLVELKTQRESATSGTNKLLELPALKRSCNHQKESYQQIIDDHELIAQEILIKQNEITQIIEVDPNFAPAHLWLGLKYEKQGNLTKARASYQKALTIEQSSNWQNLFRLILVDAEQVNMSALIENTELLLSNYPDFPMRSQLERLLNTAKQQTQNGASHE